MKRFTEVVVVLAIMLVTASTCWSQFTTPPSPPFTQATFGTSTSFLGGVAFAPNGDVWADNCAFSGGTMFRFPLQGHPVAVNSGTPGLTGCGLTNHPNGKLYSNTDLGVAELSNPMASTTAPTLLRTIGLAGNALGITVDPQTNHLVYVGADCRFTSTCTIYDLDPTLSTPTSTPIVSLSNTVASYVDGIAFDPSGNFLFLSTRSPSKALTILRRNGNFVQQVINDICNEGCLREPDGIAFHAASPQFVVTDNTDGDMTRFDFPSDDFTQPPIRSSFASGGLRGDLSQVGPDGCLYISQDLRSSPAAPSDIAQICGGFASSANSQSVTLTFSPAPGGNTQTATFLTNNNLSDPASHAMSLTITSVLNTFDVVLTAHYVPTEFSTGRTGPGIADGICELGSGTPTDDNIDCRLSAGGFVYPTNLIIPGNKLVPHCTPYHNNMCVWYSVSTAAKATDQGGTDYTGPVVEKMGWNTNVDLANPSTAGTPNREYLPGWNNKIERLYDRHGEDPNPFKYDITLFFDVTCNIFCVIPQDQAGTGITKHLNDFVWADVPNPPTGTAPATFEPVVPVPGSSPFTYLSGLPMLVAFELENESTDRSIANALTKPNSVNISTFDSKGTQILVQYPPGFPTTFTYNPFFKVYYIFLSPAPYLADGTTVYTMQIGSTLFPPVNMKFVVKKFQFQF
ncbi:MAG TPA: hypothetical protein VOA64_15875 [Candidatus Dormibacteraeota bacterium]|nr:hypothetical protein [Candidatus Dormibacteraeota bacterium]